MNMEQTGTGPWELVSTVAGLPGNGLNVPGFPRHEQLKDTLVTS